MMIKNCWKMKKRGRKFREKREKAEEETWKWVDKDEASRQKERSIGMNLASIDSSEWNSCGQDRQLQTLTHPIIQEQELNLN